MPGTTDILGHATVLDQLWSALRAEEAHHAYLFEGPKGVGKRTVAERYAMAANCERDGERPCGTCRSCHTIASGAHPDVIRLEPPPDRATRIIPVKDVREVIRKSGYHRYGGRRRVVIIDPAEAMQPAAANALLKTLEEPPEGTGFILIASHASALLPTIVSRCQRVRFGPVPMGPLAAWLGDRGHRTVAEQAAALSLGCPGRALALAEGGLKRRLKLRDQVLDALAGGADPRQTLARKLTSGDRQKWGAAVQDVLEVLEDLLRDATVQAAGGGQLLNADRADVVDRWSRALWPTGVERCARAIADSRDALEVYVTGRTVVDALLGTFARELGPAAHT